MRVNFKNYAKKITQSSSVTIMKNKLSLSKFLTLQSIISTQSSNQRKSLSKLLKLLTWLEEDHEEIPNLTSVHLTM